MATALLNRMLKAVEDFGLLLQSDASLPNIVTLISGDLVKGSWWSHPKGNLIYNTCADLGDHPDVIAVKLIAGKVTFVHRKLWAALVAAGEEKAPWQMKSLSELAKWLLTHVEKVGAVRVDHLPPNLQSESTSSAVKELEGLLLIYAESVHTESGNHVKELSSWERFVRIRDVERDRPSPQDGVREIEARLLDQLPHGVRLPSLPWRKAVTQKPAKAKEKLTKTTSGPQKQEPVRKGKRVSRK